MKSLLYLEDDPALAFVTKRFFQDAGYRVHHASDLDTLRQLIPGRDYHYCLLDLKIGNQSSLTMIQEIKAANNVPIVVVSGYGTIRTAVRAMKLGAIDFLSKPCSLTDVLQAFDELSAPQAPPTDSRSSEALSLKAVEREAIQKALDDNNGNVSAAARQLNMHRRTLQRKLQKKHTEIPTPRA